MSVYNWALRFKYLMNLFTPFSQIEILPGSNVTIMDFIVGGLIVFIVVKGLVSLYH